MSRSEDSFTTQGTSSPAADNFGEDAAQTMAFDSSRAQQRFWALALSNPADTTLNVAMRYRLAGRVVPKLLERALNALIERHELLRTGFEEDDGVPMQIVHPHLAMQLATIDLSLLSEEQRSAELDRISLSEATSPFDIERPPLMRATLIKLGESEHVLLLTLHHIVCDGWSMGIISHELMLFYDAAAAHRSAALEPLSIQYADFASWQNAWLETGIDAERAYWTRQLSGIQPFELPTDFPRATRGHGGEMASKVLDRTLTDAMQRLARERSTTFFGICLTGLAIFCKRMTGTGEVVVGTQIAGRDRPETEPLVGPFINTVPLRFDVSGDPAVSELVGRVARTVRDAIAHQQMPIDEMIRIARPSREQARLPLFTINCIAQRAFTRTEKGRYFELSGLPSVSPGCIYDLNLIFVERRDGWRMSLEYDPALFRRETVEHHLAAIESVLRAAVDDADTTVSAEAFSLPPLMREPAGSAASGEPADLHSKQDNASSSVEPALGRIWCDVLGLAQVKGSDNFFDLGGHSLLAFRLMARVRKAFSSKLDLQTMYEHPTLSEMAQVVGRARTVCDEVVALEPGGDELPIFALHNTLIYRDLSRALGSRQPFLAVPMPQGADIGDFTYEEFASRYVEVIRKARPHGPYVLLGFCFAGRLSLEAARQLRAAGEEVRLVVAVDAWAPGHMNRLPRWRRFLQRWAYRWHRLVHHLSHARDGRVLSLRHVAERSDTARRVLLKASNRVRTLKGEEELALEDEELARINRIDAVCHAATHPPYDGQVLVVRSAAQPDSRLLDETLGWQALVSSTVDVCRAPGTHVEIFHGEGARTIASAIQDALAAVKSRGR